jgi:hypothetical protein
MTNIINQYGQVKLGVRIPPLYPAFVTSGLGFSYDAFDSASYPGTGNIFYDTSGNNRNMTLLNQVLPSGTPSGSNISYVNTGIKRLVFNYSAGGSNGSNSYGKVPLSTTIDANGYTFGGWVQNITGGGYTFQKGMDGVYGGWAITLSVGDASASMGIINANSQYVGFGSNLTLTSNQWYYVVGQYVHNTSLKIYVNGVLANTVNQTTTQISLRNSPGWTISGVATNIQGKSVVSTFHTYNRVLTSDEILQNFNSNKSRYGY